MLLVACASTTVPTDAPPTQAPTPSATSAPASPTPTASPAPTRSPTPSPTPLTNATLREAVTVADIRVHLEALQAIADAHGGNRATGTSGFDASVAYVEDRLVA